MPPLIAPLAQLGERLISLRAGAPADHHDVLDRGRLLDGLVGVALERNDLAAAVPAIGRNEDLGLRVVDPVAQGVGGEPAKDNRVRRADAGAGEHGDHCFGNEGEVDGHSIAALDT